jgi:cell division control protein 6
MTEPSKVFEDFLTADLIFTNKEVLRPTYVPEDLPHREEQIEKIASILAPALKGETPSNILLYGKTGTGKTACAKLVGKELELTGEKRGSSCCVPYINCEVVDSQYSVLVKLATMFNREIPPTGWSTERVYEEFKKAIDTEPKVITIILDEVDKLVKKGDGALYNLSRINSELEKAKVSIVGISNDLNFMDFLDPRVISSLGSEEVIFHPYDANQLRDILERRAKIGFKEGVLDENVIPLCAALAAKEHGDARRALDILRASGEIAERCGSKKVTEEHVRMAQDKIELDRVEEVVKTLPPQSKLVLYAIIWLERRERRGSINTGAVYEIYRQLCKKIKIEVLTPRRITELISELDMLGIISAPVISKGRGGRSKEISLSLSTPEKIKVILLDDYRLKDLAEEKYIQTSLFSVQTFGKRSRK